MSTDFGETWRSISNNLPAGSVYVIKEDPKNQNLLYVGTEFGLFVSIDRGAHWTRWKGMPTVAVYDLVVHPRDNDLILATHGRSFIVFDDITPLQQLNAAVLAAPSHVFDIGPAVQYIPNENGWFLGGRSFRAPNRTLGAFVNYYLRARRQGGCRDRDQRRRPAPSCVSSKARRRPACIASPGICAPSPSARPPADSPARFVLTNLGPFVLPGEYRVQVTDRRPRRDENREGNCRIPSSRSPMPIATRCIARC